MIRHGGRRAAARGLRAAAGWGLLLLVGCDPGPEEVAANIQSANPVVREDWAMQAAKYGDPPVVEALVAVLGDPSDKVRLAAIASLADIRDAAAVPALITRLKEDPNPRVREAAADALGRLQATDALPDLLAYASTFGPDDQGQLVALWAIGHVAARLEEPEKRQPALDLLVARREQATDKFIRFNATAALRELE